MYLDVSLYRMLNEQMNRERFNAATYDNIAGYLETVPWDGFAKWMRKAAQEEMEHYKKFNDFIVDRNELPVVTETPMPIECKGTVKECFSIAMQLERSNTLAIQELDKAAYNVEDKDACNFLIWALEEQRKAEREITDALNQLNLAGMDYAALLLLDKEYGEK